MRQKLINWGLMLEGVAGIDEEYNSPRMIVSAMLLLGIIVYDVSKICSTFLKFFSSWRYYYMDTIIFSQWLGKTTTRTSQSMDGFY